MTPELGRILRRKQGKQQRARSQRLVLLCLILMLLISSLGRLWQVWEVRREVARLHARIHSAQLVNGQLRQQVELLQSLEYVERIARDELGLVRPGEIPYLTIRPDQPKP